MQIYQAKTRPPALIGQLVQVWEASVRATHLFLSEEEILRIKEYVPQALAGVVGLTVAENEAHAPVAFMGTENGRLEMLFIAPAERGRGLGRQLLGQAIREYSVKEVTVNEQNPQAVGFYEHCGFQAYRRTEQDEQGGPYPLLYMRLVL